MKNFGTLLDHGPVWGSFTIYPARYGVTRYRLVVFPPGISAVERRMLRVWRAWPLWGAALWVGLQIGGATVGMPETALIGGTMLVIAAGAMTFALTGEARMQVRTLWAVSMAGYSHAEADQQLHTVARDGAPPSTAPTWTSRKAASPRPSTKPVGGGPTTPWANCLWRPNGPTRPEPPSAQR